jgi:hypothetical protein
MTKDAWGNWPPKPNPWDPNRPPRTPHDAEPGSMEAAS